MALQKTIRAKTGEVIYSPFTVDPSVFTIKAGYVLAYTNDDTGKRRIHLIYGPGAYFPVITTFKGTEQRATYEALTVVLLERQTRTDFLDRLERDVRQTRDTLAKTIDQLELFADRIINLQIGRVADRLLHRLQSLAEAHGEPVQGGRLLPYNLKHHHLADMLGVERESVSRALASLIKKGSVSKISTGRFKISL